jgi:phospholipase/carboxylesterase
MQELGASGERMVLGGFSQGAMLALDVALRSDRPLAGLVLMSGTLLSKNEWSTLMPARRGLPVLQSHGRQDPLLPFSIAEELRDLMVKAELDVRFVPFNGEHGISDGVVQELDGFLWRVLE